MANDEHRLAQFKALRRIGAGRFGEVFQVQHKVTGELYCWKVVAYKGLTEKEKEQLVMEVNVMRDLKHPNIVRYVDRVVDRQKHLLYIIMEYCDSGDLAENMRQFRKHYDKVNEQVIFDIALQLLFALAYCHNSSLGPKQGKILHRDLKPQNIFLHSNYRNKTRNGYICKIGDFGLCRSIGLESFAHSCVGTPYYWCPELLLSHSKNYDDKMDMWALGVVLYELSYGKTPFHKATTLAELAQQMKNGVPLPLRGRSRQLNTLLYALLQRDPARRASAIQCLGLPIWDGPVSDWFWDTVNPRDRERIYDNIIRRNMQRLPVSSHMLSEFAGSDSSQICTPKPRKIGRLDARISTEFVESDDEDSHILGMASTPCDDINMDASSVSHSFPAAGPHRAVDIAFSHPGLVDEETPDEFDCIEAHLSTCQEDYGALRSTERRSDSGHPVQDSQTLELPDNPFRRAMSKPQYDAPGTPHMYVRTPTQVRGMDRFGSRAEEATVYTRATEASLSADSQASTCVRRPALYRPIFGSGAGSSSSFGVGSPHTLPSDVPPPVGGSTICSRRKYLRENNFS
ncbi:protein kinase domain containing protein, putative [Babesia bigemina]|uniref:non-specific serine/threonine protein kinase n=1 Tax=Babesia bigemina TaxID=5866 RepID=A0A061CZ50_BABBI|nr:protein kinase domain containing protein, putative [Babesia bigemina]CDR93901.1 protein kinase domain containing protein, putative [Babesia bigemina]|eukprot:XP_012766087.1 protein kinase domain containing protein, putative [Babesia bigemina]